MRRTYLVRAFAMGMEERSMPKSMHSSESLVWPRMKFVEVTPLRFHAPRVTGKQSAKGRARAQLQARYRG